MEFHKHSLLNNFSYQVQVVGVSDQKILKANLGPKISSKVHYNFRTFLEEWE